MTDTTTTTANPTSTMPLRQQPPSPIQTQHLASSTSPTSTSPPLSASSSPASLSKKRSRSPLSIDLSNIPPLQQPAPPSNTLIITRLDDPKIFHPASLATIRQHIADVAALNSFSPLKSMHRIICSFYDVDAAIAVRQVIDGTAVLGNSVAKCYFGEPTPIGDEKKKYLDRPDAGRLFFISPPPSPPVGWEMRTEDPPNKQVHADDLATKLEKLTGRFTAPGSGSGGDDSSEDDEATKQYSAEALSKLKASRASAFSAVSAGSSPTTGSSPKKARSRSSTLIYDPKAHGDSPALPAVMLETEDDLEAEVNIPMKKLPPHTSRPPVELMEH